MRRHLSSGCSAANGAMCMRLAWMKTQPRFGPVDQKGAMTLLARLVSRMATSPPANHITACTTLLCRSRRRRSRQT